MSIKTKKKIGGNDLTPCPSPSGEGISEHRSSGRVCDNNGFALYLVVIVLGIIGIFLLIILQSTGLAQRSAIKQLHQYNAELLAKSGLVRAEYFLNGNEGHDLSWETDTLVEPIDSVSRIMVSCRRWRYSGFIAQGENCYLYRHSYPRAKSCC